jgi:hypothetical protein
MKTLILSLAPVLFSATISAQGVFSNKTQSVLEKVIQDYPNHFYNIKGDLIGQTHQTAEYRSTLQLPGATSCTITLINASQKAGYNWTCAVFEAESFAQASARFREIYGQIGNSIITTSHRKTFILTGQFEDPAEDKKLTHIVFTLLPGVEEVKKLKVELSLLQVDGGKWKILLSVNDQDPKSMMQSDITAN